MSGGALDYAYSRVVAVADKIREKSPNYGNNPLWIAFVEHLDFVARALRDLEWEWSSDFGEGDADEAIRACLKMNRDEVRDNLVHGFLEADDILFGWTLDELITGGQGTIEQGRKKREDLIDILVKNISSFDFEESNLDDNIRL